MVEQQQILSRFILAPSLQYDQSHEDRVRQHWNASLPLNKLLYLSFWCVVIMALMWY